MPSLHTRGRRCWLPQYQPSLPLAHPFAKVLRQLNCSQPWSLLSLWSVSGHVIWFWFLCCSHGWRCSDWNRRETSSTRLTSVLCVGDLPWVVWLANSPGFQGRSLSPDTVPIKGACVIDWCLCWVIASRMCSVQTSCTSCRLCGLVCGNQKLQGNCK